MTKRLMFFAMAFSLPLIFFARAQEESQPENTYEIVRANFAVGNRWMIAAAHPLAAEVGATILSAGGSAADAAVAVQLMLNLVEPQSSGIGGGAFALYWDESQKQLTSWDAREKAPVLADENYWLDANGNPIKWRDAVAGGRSVGVPGALKLLETLHQKYGRLFWSDLFAPTIEKAKNGFSISPRLANSIKDAAEKKLDFFNETKKYFFNSDNSPKETGAILKNPQFARTLRLLADEGSTPFYQGKIAADIVNAVKTKINPGILTLSDFANYKVKERPPICVNYRGNRVCGMGPPSSGGLTVAQILMMLENFDLAKIGDSTLSRHLFAEAAKLAYADRNLYIADDDFVKIPSGFLDADYLSQRAKLINPSAAMKKAQAGTPTGSEFAMLFPDSQLNRPGTSHFVIADKHGDMISMTTTIESAFGSGVMINGFLLNNELTDFSLSPEKDGKKIANRVEGGKRPRSSMSPTIVFRNGRPILLIGSPGGSRIINYVAEAIIAILDWKMHPADAVSLGHIVNRNGATELEENTQAESLASELESLGHEIKFRDLNSGLHLILIADDELIGAADPRREGIAKGK